MSQIAFPQQHPSARLTQGIEGRDGLNGVHVNPPAALGRRHSCGHTVARIALAIITVSVSEIVIGILKGVLAWQARARARLPENQPPVAVRPSIATLNTTKANVVGTMMDSVNFGRDRALAILGTLGTLDNAAFTKDLKRAIKLCPTEVTDEKLDELSEQVARNSLINSMVSTLVNNDPQSVTLTEDERRTIMDQLFKDPQGVSLRTTNRTEDVQKCYALWKSTVTQKVTFQVLLNDVTKQLLTEGMQEFATSVGRQLGTFTLEMSELKGELQSQSKKLPLTTNMKALRSTMKPLVDTYFTSRAKAYNSISFMDIPDAIKQNFQGLCLTYKHLLPSTLFSKAMEVATRMQERAVLDVLVATLPQSDLSVDTRINAIEDFACEHIRVVEEVVTKNKTNKEFFSADDLALFMYASYMTLFGKHLDFLFALSQTPALLGSLEDTVADRFREASGFKSEKKKDQSTIHMERSFQFLVHTVKEVFPKSVIQEDNNIITDLI